MLLDCSLQRYFRGRPGRLPVLDTDSKVVRAIRIWGDVLDGACAGSAVTLNVQNRRTSQVSRDHLVNLGAFEEAHVPATLNHYALCIGPPGRRDQGVLRCKDGELSAGKTASVVRRAQGNEPTNAGTPTALDQVSRHKSAQAMGHDIKGRLPARLTNPIEKHSELVGQCFVV